MSRSSANGLPTGRWSGKRTVPACVSALAEHLVTAGRRRDRARLAAGGCPFGRPRLAHRVRVAHDESALRVESNVFRYRSAPQVIVRAEPDARPAHVVRLLLAAELAGTEVALSLAPEFVAALPVATTGALDQARRQLEPIWRVESASELASRAAAGRIGWWVTRLR